MQHFFTILLLKIMSNAELYRFLSHSLDQPRPLDLLLLRFASPLKRSANIYHPLLLLLFMVGRERPLGNEERGKLIGFPGAPPSPR